MLRRLAAGVTLVVALALAGCTPPEPTLTDEQRIAQASDTFEGFYAVVDEQFAAGQASPAAFSQFATPELGSQWANDIQAALNAGTSSRGVLELTNVELRQRSVTGFTAALCTDGSGIEGTDATGTPIPPSGLLAWDAAFTDADDGSRVLLDQLEPSEDSAVCEA